MFWLALLNYVLFGFGTLAVLCIVNWIIRKQYDRQAERVLVREVELFLEENTRLDT